LQEGQYESSVPTVADRVAQTVAAMALEARTESIFHEDSYGYRPRRGALDAVAKCRLRCWKKDWVIDLDVQKFFDSVPWDLMVKAVEANITDSQKWVLLYVKRWLAAPLQLPDGTLDERDRGTAQGSAVSPVLANLFMHYAFDLYLVREFPAVQFERYADDAVVHCAPEREARVVLAALARRMEEAGLRLHPAKTKIVFVNMNAGGGCDGGPDGCGSLRGDGGAWPSGDALRGESSNHPPVPWLKTVVLNGAGKVGT
jgi:RNA-directed DNA polymerase